MGKSAQIETEAPPSVEKVAIEADSVESISTDSTIEQPELPQADPPPVAAEIVAIGKTVSNANGTILKGALDNLLKVAVASGVLSESELLDMFYKYTKVAESLEDENEDDQNIAAGALADSTKSRVWQRTLDTIVECFTSAVREMSWMDSNSLTHRYQTDDCKKIYSTLLDDLVPMLEDLGDRVEVMREMKLACSSIEDGTELEMPIQLARSNNKHQFSGTLFQVDRPSEGVPSIGPGVPLFVPREVAIKAIADVSGLPLDAKQGFGGHANKNIVGAMKKAELVGDEIVVHAQLFNWSQPELVTAIAAEKETLGMSMNANSLGRLKVLSCGTKVFQIDNLELLGANILRAKNATYSKTSVIAAEKLGETDDSDLGSDGDPDSTDTEVEVDDSEIEAFFDAIDMDVAESPRSGSPTMRATQAAASTSFNPTTTPITDMDLQDISEQITVFSSEVSDSLSIQEQKLTLLMADYEQRAAIQAAAISAQQQNASKDDMKSMLKEMIGELQASGAISAPDKSARKTIPLSAGTRSVAPVVEEGGESIQIQLQLAAISGQLEELNNNPYADNLKIIELTEKRHQLASMLNR